MAGPSAPGRPRLLYLLNGFMQGLSLGIFALAAIAWWVVDLDLSPIRLVLLGIVLEGMVLLSESPTGVVADVFSRKWSIVVSWLIMGISQGLSPISESLPILLIWQGLFGFGYTFQSGADTAWVTDEIGREDDSLVMSKAIAMSFGIIVGVGAAMAMTQWSLRGTMAVSGAVSLAFGLFLAAAMGEHNFSPVDRSQRSTSSALVDTWRRGFRAIRVSRVLRALMLATIIVAMVDEMVDRLDFARMREVGFPELDGSDSALLFGAIWIGMTILTLPAMVLVGRRLDGATDRRSALLMVGLLALGSIGVGLMAGSVFVLAVIGWVMRDVIREVVSPIGEAWVNRHAESDLRATVISFRSQAMAFGQIAGGLLLGTLAELVSLQIAFAVGAVLLGCSALPVARLLFDRSADLTVGSS